MAKSQSALEYLLIIAVALGVIIPTTYLFFRYSAKSNDEILDSQINQIGKTIMDTAETVFFSGESSKIVVEVTIPKRVVDVYILSNRELVFKLLSGVGETESVFFSSPNIPVISDDTNPSCVPAGSSCSLSSLASEGLKKVKIQAENDISGNTRVVVQQVT